MKNIWQYLVNSMWNKKKMRTEVYKDDVCICKVTIWQLFEAFYAQHF